MESDHYEVRRLKVADLKADRTLVVWMGEVFDKNNDLYGQGYNWRDFDFDWIDENYFAVCFRDSKPIGLLVASLQGSFFDRSIKILRQVTSFAVPNTRATYHLLRDFIDFGKCNANHIVTMIAAKTNIKPKSLEKLGFKKIEEAYRLEVE